MAVSSWSNFKISFTSAIAIITIVIGGSIAWANVTDKVKTNETSIEKIVKEVDTVQSDIKASEKERSEDKIELAREITSMAGDIRYLREKIDQLLRYSQPANKGP